MTLRGQRQNGESHLVQEFCNQAEVPHPATATDRTHTLDRNRRGSSSQVTSRCSAANARTSSRAWRA